MVSNRKQEINKMFIPPLYNVSLFNKKKKKI